jgi:putative endonuclease
VPELQELYRGPGIAQVCSMEKSTSAADSRQSLGHEGETLARRELERRGYEILACGFRVRGGEIDIVARDGATLVFVEVRTRAGDRCGTAAESVTRRKQRQIARVARAYLAAETDGPEPSCRFDVVAVDFAEDGHVPRVTVYPAAFEAG